MSAQTRFFAVAVLAGALSASHTPFAHADYVPPDGICYTRRDAPEGQSGWGIACRNEAGGLYGAMSFRPRADGFVDYEVWVMQGTFPEDEKCPTGRVRCHIDFGRYHLVLNEGDWLGTAQAAPDYAAMQCECWWLVSPPPP